MWCVYYQDGIQALKDVNFTRQPGETVALFGPNGPGKTTFVPQHKGVLRGEGSITIRGLPMTKDNLPKIRSRIIGMVFQNSDEQLLMPTVLDDGRQARSGGNSQGEP